MTLVSVLAIAGAGGYGIYFVLTRDEQPKPELRVSQLADAKFPADKSAPDGLNQTISDVAAVGNTIVATGSEIGDGPSRPLFLFSADQGRTWQTATVKAPDNGAPSGAAAAIVGTEGAWLALGGNGDDRHVWTSTDGRSWSQLNRVAAFRADDRIAQITRTTRGYVAVGYRGAAANSSPVVWLSGDGKAWQRLDGNKLKLKAKGGSASQLSYVTAVGDRLLVSGQVVKAKETLAAIWRSTDGGRTWTALNSPTGDQAFGPIHLGATDTGFFAMREGKDGDARVGVVFRSTTGDDWTTHGRIATSSDAAVAFRQMTVGPQGFAVLTSGPGSRASVYQSPDGAAWQRVGDLNDNPARVPTRLAAAGSTTVLGGTLRQGNDQNGYLAVMTGPGNLTEVDLAKISGAVNPERSVNDLFTAAGRTVAVGSSNGRAAAWSSGDGNNWTRANTASLGGSGKQSFVKVAYGTQGWVAIGEQLGRPLAATSSDGSSWQRIDDNVFAPKKGDAITLASVAHGPKGYVIVGTATTNATKATSAVAWHSADLKTWQRSEAANFKSKSRSWHKVLGLAGGSSNYVAVGETSDPGKSSQLQSRPAVWTSTDGRSWTERPTSLPDKAKTGSLSSVAINGNTVVASGEATFTGTRVYALTSNDLGTTWRATRLPTPVAGQPSYFTGITPTTKGIAIVGTLGGTNAGDVLLWNSTDGQTWRTVAPKGVGLSGNGYQRINALTELDGRLLGVGTTTDSGLEHVTLWRPPIS